MFRYVAPLAVFSLLSGCGLGETAATTAAIAEAKQQELKSAKETQEKIVKEMENAQAAAAEQRAAAEAASE